MKDHQRNSLLQGKKWNYKQYLKLIDCKKEKFDLRDYKAIVTITS